MAASVTYIQIHADLQMYVKYIHDMLNCFCMFVLECNITVSLVVTWLATQSSASNYFTDYVVCSYTFKSQAKIQTVLLQINIWRLFGLSTFSHYILCRNEIIVWGKVVTWAPATSTWRVEGASGLRWVTEWLFAVELRPNVSHITCQQPHLQALTVQISMLHCTFDGLCS